MDHLIGEFWIRHSNLSLSLLLALDFSSSAADAATDAALSAVVILNIFSFFLHCVHSVQTKFEYQNRINGTLRIAYVGDAFLDKINDSNIRVYDGKWNPARKK